MINLIFFSAFGALLLVFLFEHSKQQNDRKFPLKTIVIGLSSLILGLLILHFSVFSYPYILPEDISKWGSFGDFFGGVLNPLFGFGTVILLIFSIRLQLRELEYTRQELKNTNEELTRTREVHKDNVIIQSQASIIPIIKDEIQLYLKELQNIMETPSHHFMKKSPLSFIRSLNNIKSLTSEDSKKEEWIKLVNSNYFSNANTMRTVLNAQNNKISRILYLEQSIFTYILDIKKLGAAEVIYRNDLFSIEKRVDDLHTYHDLLLSLIDKFEGDVEIENLNGTKVTDLCENLRRNTKAAKFKFEGLRYNILAEAAELKIKIGYFEFDRALSDENSQKKSMKKIKDLYEKAYLDSQQTP